MTETDCIETVPSGPPPTSWWKRLARRLAKVAAVTAVLILILIAAHRPLLVGFAYLMRVDNPAPSDAIILLLGGNTHRPAKAAELYQRGLAPIILLCHERPDPDATADESDMIKRRLTRLGVPPGAVSVLPVDVTSTREEAQRVATYLEHHPARRITIVTTAFHTARARWIFRRVLSSRGIGVDVRAAATTHPNFDESNWYQEEEGLVQYLNEAIKTIFYRLKY